MNCKFCEGNSFVQATDYINLRPLDKKMTIGSEKVYTVPLVPLGATGCACG
jgi:hypothetical protein